VAGTKRVVVVVVVVSCLPVMIDEIHEFRESVYFICSKNSSRKRTSVLKLENPAPPSCTPREHHISDKQQGGKAPQTGSEEFFHLESPRRALPSNECQEARGYTHTWRKVREKRILGVILCARSDGRL